MLVQRKNLLLKACSGKKSLEKTVFSVAKGQWVEALGIGGEKG
jgi:hypothetical protein